MIMRLDDKPSSTPTTSMVRHNCNVGLLIATIVVFVITNIVTAILLGVYAHKYNEKKDVPTLLGYEFLIKTTWDGRPIDHDPIRINMQWQDYNKAILVKFEAPLYNNPPAPNATAGVVQGLWDYEVVEIFIANDKEQYLEMELGPHNQWLCLLLDGARKPFNTGDYLQLSVWNQIWQNSTHWSGQVEIPLAYLPYNISSLNAYNIHVEGTTKIYEALSPAPTDKFQGPDFHRLQYFLPIDGSRLIPSEYNNPEKVYLDDRYGDLWKGHE